MNRLAHPSCSRAKKNTPGGNGKCLQQKIADHAITTAKSMLKGPEQARCIGLAINYRSLERHTQKIAQPSDLCDETPKNQE
jgi:hypothetical protein